MNHHLKKEKSIVKVSFNLITQPTAHHMVGGSGLLQRWCHKLKKALEIKHLF